MNRRQFLALCGGAVLSAGCTETASRSTVPEPSTAGSEPTANRSRAEAAPLARRGEPAGICGHTPTKVGIRAISVPATGDDWDGVDTRGYGRLTPDTVVVGVATDAHQRAYPIRVLWEHEVVNDAIAAESGKRPILVTYCSICRSAMVAERLVDGRATVFGVSGLLWRPPDRYQPTGGGRPRVFGADLDGPTGPKRLNNLVMYDVATGSYWSQFIARAICGPSAGASLDLLPASVSTWAVWKREHPESDVLLPPPRSGAFNPPYPGSAPPGTPTG